MYISWSSTNETMPRFQLAGFQRYYMKGDSSQEFKFVITPEQMAVWTDARGFVVQPGKLQIYQTATFRSLLVLILVWLPK